MQFSAKGASWRLPSGGATEAWLRYWICFNHLCRGAPHDETRSGGRAYRGLGTTGAPDGINLQVPGGAVFGGGHDEPVH